MKILDFNYIKSLNISPLQVYNWCIEAWKIKDDCVLPTKMKMWQGEFGRYITMPCVIPQIDVAGVKFIARNIDDANGIPARNSNIMIQKCSEMGLIGILDGIWITNMRTGAIAARSAVQYAKKNPQTIGIMGLGRAAWSFMYIFGSVVQNKLTIKLLKYKDQAERFVNRFVTAFPNFTFEIIDNVKDICSCDIVVSAISYSHAEIANESVYKPGCLIVPIHQGGFQNCDIAFDRIAIDDYGHIKGFRYYDEVVKKSVEMSKVEKGVNEGRQDDTQRMIAYCGGIAVHDIYIADKILKISEEKGNAPDIKMTFPDSNLWI